MVIAIAVKGLTAVDTSEVIDGLAFDRLRVAVPPGHAADVRAEFFLPIVRGAHQLGSTLEAQFFLAVRIPPADRFDRIQRVAGEDSNLLIAQPLFPIP